MAEHSDQEISLLTRILQQRLTQMVVFGINIIEEEEVFRASSVSNLKGLLIGFFTRRQNENLIFVLLIRQGPESTVSRAVVFYVNTNCQDVLKSERDRLIKIVPRGIMLSVVNIKTRLPYFSYPSFLATIIECVIRIRLLDTYKPYYPIYNETGSTFVVSDPQPCPECDIDTLNTEARQVLDTMKRLGFRMVSFNRPKPSPIPIEFHILKIINDGHLLYGIHHPVHNLLLLLLPHSSQLKSERDVGSLIDLVKEYSVKSWSFVEPLRYYSKPTVKCNSAEVLKACLLALSHPFIFLCRTDVETMIPGDGMDHTMTSRVHPTVSPSQGSQSSIIPELDEDDTIIDVVTTSSSPYIIRDNQIGSQSSNLSTSSNNSLPNLELYQAEILAEVKRMDRCSDLKILVDEYDFPLKNVVSPKNDPNNEILDDTAFFLEELQWIAYLGNARTTAVVAAAFTPTMLDSRVHFDDNDPTRFLIIPFLDTDFHALLIIDRQNEEWGYINPDNDAAKNIEAFLEIDSTASKCCGQLKDYVGQSIAITSSFHKEHPKIHLLMSLFHMVKLFRYAPILPRKIIYQEKSFREFCDQVTHELRAANMLYNLENGYLKPGGGVADEGYISPEWSKVQFERSVVKSDQCRFCLKRGYSNLVNHMVTKHGDYGRMNVKRRWNPDH